MTKQSGKAKKISLGDEMPDGTIYAGISPDTGKAMYTTPSDAPLTMTFNKAKEYAAKLDAHGHKDWHVPTTAELNVLFNNRVAIGGFNPADYWSSSQGRTWGATVDNGESIGFARGTEDDYSKEYRNYVRCVR